MKLLAFDLSMTATGAVLIDTEAPAASWYHGMIKTPARKAGQADLLVDLSRFRLFLPACVSLLGTFKPDVLAVEVTRHTHHGKGAREFRAGLYLGIARGWLVAALELADAYGLVLPDIVWVESSDAKRATTGNASARKVDVRAILSERLGLDLADWTDDEVDALSVGLSVLVERNVIVAPQGSHG